MDKLVDLALKRKRESSMKTVSYDQNIFNLGKGLKGGKMGGKTTIKETATKLTDIQVIDYSLLPRPVVLRGSV